MLAPRVHGLLLTATGDEAQRRFFDELIPSLDAATGDVVQIYSFGDAVSSGDNFTAQVIERLLKTTPKRLSAKWKTSLRRWQDAGLAISKETALACSALGVEPDDRPCIVFLATGAGINEREILRIPGALLEHPSGRSFVERTLLDSLSAKRFASVAGTKNAMGGPAVVERWNEHARQVSHLLSNHGIDSRFDTGSGTGVPRRGGRRTSDEKLTRKEQAERLGVSVRMVTNYVRELRDKLGREPNLIELHGHRKESASRNPKKNKKK